MVFLKLQQQAFRKIDMLVNVGTEPDMELESSFSFSMDYNDVNTQCVARLNYDIHMKGAPEKLKAEVECLGVYSCQGIEKEEDKKQAHVQAYQLLFPYVQGMIAHLMVSAGMPALMVEMMQLNPDDIVLNSQLPQ